VAIVKELNSKENNITNSLKTKHSTFTHLTLEEDIESFVRSKWNDRRKVNTYSVIEVYKKWLSQDR
jgi:hypothetical protein